MYHPISLFVAIRYIKGRPTDRFARFVSFFSTIGITLGVMALIAVTSVMNGFEKMQEEALLRFQPHALLSSVDGSLQLDKNSLSATPELDEFLNININKKLINHTESIVQSQVILQSSKGISSSLMLGVLPQDFEPLFDYFEGIDSNVLEEGKFNAVLGYALAQQLNVTIGDEIRILVPSVSQITPLGRIPSQRKFTVAGVFSSNNQVDSQQLFVNKADGAKLMRYKEGRITGLRLFLNSPLEIAKLDSSMLNDKWILSDWRERQGELFQAIKMEKNMMGLLLSLIIAVAIFNIFTSLCLIVLEKQNEIAILQTLGIKQRQLLSIFVIQGAMSGILGALIGGLLGILLCLFINDIPLIAQSIGRELPMAFDIKQFISIILSAIILALLSALYPAIKASKILPAQALRYE
ncbi:lipoprotein-releasing ABC transporter permease subunit LolC [Thorsellia kenyensis]|uniref:Lipoprotein-releasing ABC transporter permease subunit LolC n=1 Tax=Thorsellia kenyensis TaxID=1549888 RepID=A0ABV6CCM9_9GAMM